VWKDEIPNGQPLDRTGVEHIDNHLRETRLTWLGLRERMNGANLIKEERVPGNMKRGRLKKF